MVMKWCQLMGSHVLISPFYKRLHSLTHQLSVCSYFSKGSFTCQSSAELWGNNKMLYSKCFYMPYCHTYGMSFVLNFVLNYEIVYVFEDIQIITVCSTVGPWCSDQRYKLIVAPLYQHLDSMFFYDPFAPFMCIYVCMCFNEEICVSHAGFPAGLAVVFQICVSHCNKAAEL